MRGKIVQVLKGYATDASDKPNTSIDYDRIDDLAESIVKLFAIPVVSNSVCFIPDSIECGFRNRKGECTSLGDCLKANDCITVWLCLVSTKIHEIL